MGIETNESKTIVKYYSENDRKDYTDFLFSRPDSNIYHTIEWKEVLESHYNFDPFYLVARDGHGDICAVLPLFYLKNWCGKRLDSLPLSIYGGVLGDKKYVKPLIKKVFELKRKLKCKYVVIRQPPPGHDSLFEDLSMKKEERRWSQCLRIEDPKVLWKKIKKANRNCIRKAKENDVRVKRLTKEDDLKEFHRLELLTGKRLGFPTPSLNFFKELWNKMHQKGYVEVFIAKHKGKAIATTLVFPFNKRVTYGFANSETKEIKLRPNNLLLWEVIEWCYKKGYDFFDLGATPKDNKGLFFFKSTFHTLNTPYASYYFPGDTILLEDTVIVKLGEKIFQKTPIYVSKEVGPFLIKKFG